MQIKFSEDVIPLTDLKINPGKIVNQTKESHRPVLLTSRGRGVAIVQGLEDYEKDQEQIAFIKAIAQGLVEIKNGQVTELSSLKQSLGLG
jgi:prevent-host-death family protein